MLNDFEWLNILQFYRIAGSQDEKENVPPRPPPTPNVNNCALQLDPLAADEGDLYVRYKKLLKQLEFLEVQVS